MRINLSRHLTKVMLWIIIVFVVPACNSSPASVTSVPTPAPHPSDAPSPTSSPTQMRTASPAPSDTPPSAVPCFVSYYDPFAFMPDGEHLLVKADNGVQVFNLQTMQQESFLQAPTNLNGPAVALSPDGKIMAWALEDGSIQGIRMSDQTVVFTIESGQADSLKLEFSPRGDDLFSASHDGSIKVWDNQGNLENTLQPGGELLNMGISPDGKSIATIPFDGPVSLWSLDDFHLIKELGGTGGYDTSDAVFSPDGQFLVADLATSLFLWNISDGTELLSASDPINSMAVAYAPDGHLLAYGGLSNVVISSPDGSQIIRILEGHQAPIFALLFSPDSSILVSSAEDLRIWRVEDGQLLAIGKSECP